MSKLIHIDPYSVALIELCHDDSVSDPSRETDFYKIYLKSNNSHVRFDTPGENDAAIERLIDMLDVIKLSVISR